MGGKLSIGTLIALLTFACTGKAKLKVAVSSRPLTGSLESPDDAAKVEELVSAIPEATNGATSSDITGRCIGTANSVRVSGRQVQSNTQDYRLLFDSSCSTDSGEFTGRLDLSVFSDGQIEIKVEYISDGIVVYTTTKVVVKDTVSPVLSGGSALSTLALSSTQTRVSWPVASDNLADESSLRYELRVSAINNLAAVSDIEANGTVVVPYNAGITSYTFGDAAPGGSQYFNVIVKDQAGNKASYSAASSKSPVDKPAQRHDSQHTFFDQGAGRHWMLQHASGKLFYLYSNDGATWTAAGSFALASGKFSIRAWTNASTTRVFVATEENDYDIRLRRGTVQGTSLVFTDPVTVFDGTGAGDTYRGGAILADGDDLWVAAAWGNGNLWRNRIRKATGTPDDSAISFGAAESVGMPSTFQPQISLAPLGTGSALLLAKVDSSVFAWSNASGTWQEAHAGGARSWNVIADSSYPDDIVDAIAVDGDDIYIGGYFTNAFGLEDGDHIAHWDGSAWRSVGGGLNGDVHSLYVHRGLLYVGGEFTDAGGVAAADRIAVWDGRSWTALGAGIQAVGGAVYDIAAVESAIYVGGSFSAVGGVANTNNIARWDGSQWHALGTGTNGNVSALSVSSAGIYAGGSFAAAGGVSNTGHIAFWNGSAWNALGTGLSNSVNALFSNGSDLYVGGSFTNAGSLADADYIARWNGSSWAAVAAGVNSQVNAITMYGGSLVIGGNFNGASGGPNGTHLLRLNGSSWATIDGGVFGGGVYSLATSGTSLLVGGTFGRSIGGVTRRNLVRWDGQQWGTVSRMTPEDLTSIASIVATAAGVFVGGTFQNLGGIANANNIARWDGSAWHAVGNGLNEFVSDMKSDGTWLYIGGAFTAAGGLTDAGGIPVGNRIVRYKISDGTWEAVGGGIPNGHVTAIALGESDVYVGGSFTDAGGNANADRVAKLSGTTWANIANGLSNTPGTGALAVFNGDLYAGGGDALVGAVDYLARFDGSNWVSVVGTTPTGVNGQVSALAASDTKLYVGGNFTSADSVGNTGYCASWNGTAWAAIGNGCGGHVKHLIVTTSSGTDTVRASGAGVGVKTFTTVDTAWSDLNYPLINGARTIGVDGAGDVWAAGIWGGFAKYANSVVANTVAASAGANGTGNPMILYEDGSASHAIKVKTLVAGTWSAAITLVAGPAASPILSIDGSSIAGFWLKQGQIFSKAFDGSAWEASATSILGGTTPVRWPGCHVASGGAALCAGLSGGQPLWNLESAVSP